MSRFGSSKAKKHHLMIIIFFLFISILTIKCFYEDFFNNNDLGFNRDTEYNLDVSGDRLTLINNSMDFLKVDNNIYIMEAVNFTFYYTDLETNTTIFNLDNQTYYLQKLNISGEVIERSNGTLFTAPDNATILDLGTELLSLGDYTILVYFNKIGYEPKNAIINLHVINRPTLINNLDTIDLIYEEIYEGEIISFNFSYKDKLTGINLTNLDNRYYLWEKYNEEGILISNGQEDLFPDINDFYILDFHTENKTNGNYVFIVFLRKTNYTQKTALVNLTINKRDFLCDLSQCFVNNGNEYEIHIKKGHSAILTINLTDPTRNFIPLKNASIILTIGNKEFNFIEIHDGVYEYEFLTNNINSFFEPISIEGFITISKDFFNKEIIEIIVIVSMVEIFPGMALFYFLNIIGAFSIISIVLILYRKKLKKEKEI